MGITDFMLYKALALCVVVAIVNFVYAFITGRTIEEARNDAAASAPSQPADSQAGE
jgi:hypothetical protein